MYTYLTGSLGAISSRWDIGWEKLEGMAMHG